MGPPGVPNPGPREGAPGSIAPHAAIAVESGMGSGTGSGVPGLTHARAVGTGEAGGRPE